MAVLAATRFPFDSTTISDALDLRADPKMNRLATVTKISGAGGRLRATAIPLVIYTDLLDFKQCYGKM